MASRDFSAVVRLLRNAFLGGVVILLPLGVTVFILNFLIERIGAPASQYLFFFLDQELRQNQFFSLLLGLIALVIVAALVTCLGLLSKLVFGRLLIGLTESLLDRVPFFNTVYRSVKQIVDTFSHRKKAVFQQVVLVEYPRRGVYAVGFLTSEAEGEAQAKTGATLLNVFVPTTPNPTSGFLLLMPEEEVIFLQMTVAEGMKMIISGGAVTPPYDPSKDVGKGAENLPRPSELTD